MGGFWIDYSSVRGGESRVGHATRVYAGWVGVGIYYSYIVGGLGGVGGDYSC